MTWLISLLTGNVLSSLTGSLNQAWKDYLQADTDDKKIEAERQIAFFKGQIELAVAASQNDKWWSTRELIGKCVLIYVGKIVVWDTVLKIGFTPDPGPQVTGIVMAVIGFYYGSKAVSDIGSKLLAAAIQRK